MRDDISKLRVFMSTMQDICRKYTPMRKLSSVRQNIIPRDRKILMRRKKVSNHLNKNITRKERDQLNISLVGIESKLKRSHEAERAAKEAWAVENIRTNPKVFYSFAKETAAVRHKIGPLFEGSKSLTADPYKVSEILNEQFNSMFTTPLVHKQITKPTEFFKTKNLPGGTVAINHIDIEEIDVIAAIDKMDINSAAGPDGFPTILLKTCKKALAKPLQIMFQSFLESGKIPKNLKEGIICPIHKGGSRAHAKNYRPISLTSHISKTMERIVREKLTIFLEENGLLSETQHGFRQGRSCLTQLLQHYDWILKESLNRSNVDVVYLDFAKAFDKVDHGTICHKLRSLGIVGKLGEWLHDFLTDRSQVVAANGAHSKGSTIRSGVPQGTVLGPLLFVIALSDLPSVISTATLTSYADDTKISKAIKGPDDIKSLQADIDAV